MQLTRNTPMTFEMGNRSEFPVDAATVIYEGAAVELFTKETGNPNGVDWRQRKLARPLPDTGASRFVGFAEFKADNSKGLEGGVNVRVITKGRAVLAVPQITSKDIGQPVYAAGSGAFSRSGYMGSFVGVVVSLQREASGQLTGTPPNEVFTWLVDGIAVVDFDTSRN